MHLKICGMMQVLKLPSKYARTEETDRTLERALCYASLAQYRGSPPESSVASIVVIISAQLSIRRKNRVFL